MLIAGYVRRRENFVAAATAFEKIQPNAPGIMYICGETEIECNYYRYSRSIDKDEISVHSSRPHVHENARLGQYALRF